MFSDITNKGKYKSLKKIMANLDLIQKISELIEMQNTGSSFELAEKLGVSKSTIYNCINFMKKQNVPVEYCIYKQSFIFRKTGKLRLIYFEELY